MTVSIRSYLTAGVAAVAASAVAIAPVHALTPASMNIETMHLSAAVRPLLQPVDTAGAVLGLVNAPAPSPSAATSMSPQAQTQSQAPAVAQPYNTASNIIDAVYAVSRYWANYMSLELGPWLIGWIPFGYLINDQIYIWYPTFTLPVVDTFVYDFLDPVVNDPLNLNVWRGGLTAIANTAWNGVVSGVQQEVNYLLSLRWFPIPLPPLPSLPPLPFSAVGTSTLVEPVAATAAADLVTRQLPEAATPGEVVATTGRLARNVQGELADVVAEAVGGARLPDATDGEAVGTVDPQDLGGAAAAVEAQEAVTAQGTVRDSVREVVSELPVTAKSTAGSVRDAAKNARAAARSAAQTAADGAQDAARNAVKAAADGAQKVARNAAKAAADGAQNVARNAAKAARGASD